MKKIKGMLLLCSIISFALLINWQTISAQELTVTEKIADEDMVADNNLVENNSAGNNTEENNTEENNTEEKNTSESVAVNDTFVYEYEGQILEYRILTLADATAQGTVMVVGTQDNTNLFGELQIPASVTYFEIPYNVTLIGNNAFSNNHNITSVDLPEGINTIGDLAFLNCTGLQNVKLPSNISLLGLQAFQGTNIVFWVEQNTNAASYCRSRRYTYNYITDSETDEIALDNIAINPIFQQPYPDKLQLYIGKNATFTISYYPNNTTERRITWSSSNSTVAKVSTDGTVTAVSSGTATITALVGTKTAKMTIIVNPEAPKSIKAISTGVNSIKISWDRVRNATNYRVYRASSKSGKYTRIADVNTLYYENSGLLDATTYYYKVYAYGYIGGTYSPSYYSSKTSAKTKIGSPEFLLANYVSNQSIKLLLGRVPGASGYMIYRATSANGTYHYVNSAKYSASSYTDQSLSKGKTYYYKVKAYNYVNKTKIYSDYSKTVIAATKLPSYVTFGTSEENVYKILGRPSNKYYFAETRTYELYYKKDFMSSPVNTAAIYLKNINSEWIVVGWSNLFNELKVSDGNETNTGYFTLGSTMDEVNKVMRTPFDFEYFYGGTTFFGYQIRVRDLKYMYGSTITFNDDMKVVGWENIKGGLKVKYGSDKPTYRQITLGTSLSEVLKALGTPDALTSSGNPLEVPMHLTYGKTTLTFDENSEIAGWSNKDKLNISIGIKNASAGKVKVGTSLNNVIKAMGTPDSYIIDPNNPSKLNYVVYGNIIYNFDNNRKVSSIQSK